MLQKIRLIYFRFLIIAIAFVGLYTLLDWVLIIKYPIANLKEDLVQFWLPFCLPWIPVLIWLRPRIKLLNLVRKKGDLPSLYMFIAALAITAPTIIAQNYLATATGKLTDLPDISDISSHTPTKYYTIKSFYIDKPNTGVKYFVSVSGKHNQYLNLDIYIASPIAEVIAPPTASVHKQLQDDISPLYILNGSTIDSFQFHGIPKEAIISLDTLNATAAIAAYGKTGDHGAIIVRSKKFDYFSGPPPPVSIVPDLKACLCTYYHKQISNKLDTATEMQLRRQFYSESIKDFNDKDLSSFKYLDRIGNNSKKDGYKKAIGKITNYNSASSVAVLEPRYESFEARNGNSLIWIFGAFGIGAIVWLIMVLIPSLESTQLNNFLSGEVVSTHDNKDLYDLFIPKEGFYVTPILIWVNIIIFLLMVFAGLGFISFNTNDLLHWGANYKPVTINGQWWRLITSTFLHAGFIHLLANMYGLLFVGIFLEPALGKTKFAILYFIAGIIASITSLWWYQATVSVGASGAIFGLYGCFLAFLLLKIFPQDFSKAFLISTFIFIGYNLLVGLAGGVDNAAHISGLISGFVIGIIWAIKLKHDKLSVPEHGLD